MDRRSFLLALAAALVAPLPDARRVYSFPSEPTIWMPPGFWVVNPSPSDYGVDLSSFLKPPRLDALATRFRLPDGRWCHARAVRADKGSVTYDVTIEPRLENVEITGGFSV